VKNIRLLILAVIFIFPACKRESVTDRSNPFFAPYNTPFDVPPFE
jgi:hypothetical protein